MEILEFDFLISDRMLDEQFSDENLLIYSFGTTFGGVQILLFEITFQFSGLENITSLSDVFLDPHIRVQPATPISPLHVHTNHHTKTRF